MKKWLVFFLLLITSASMLVNCCGTDECCPEEVAAATHPEEKKEEGACSPFFACTTCPVFVEVTKHIQLAHPPSLSKPAHEERIYQYDLSAFTNAFWQPPRRC